MPVIKFAIWFLLAGFVFSSCKKETPATTQISRVPIADAGVDQNIQLPRDSIELRGQGFDVDGYIVSYEWKKISGPPQFKLIDSSTNIARIKNLVAGVYIFELKVTDNDGLSSEDQVTVSVVNPPPPVIKGSDYQSKQSGRWNDPSSWERFDGVQWVNALSPPNSSDGKITIRGGHTITVDSVAETNEIVINPNGALMIGSGFTILNSLTNNGDVNWSKGTIKLLGYYSTVAITNNSNFLITGNNDLYSDYWDSEVMFVNNGIITKTSDGTTGLDYAHKVINSSTGVIKGLGTLYMFNSDPYSFQNNGVISPGLTTGLLVINNKHPFSSYSTLNIEILDNTGPGSGHDQLVCTDDISLNGILTVKEIGGAVAKGRFTILRTSGTISGNFNQVNLPSGYVVEIKTNSVDVVKQ